MSMQSDNWLAHVVQKFWLAVKDTIGIPVMKRGVILLSGCNIQTECPEQNEPRDKYSLTAKMKDSAGVNIAYTFLCLYNSIWHNCEWNKLDFIY